MLFTEPMPKTANYRQEYFLNKAAQLAFNSTMTHKHGCVLVNSNTDEIISTGYNHTYIHMYHLYSCHAECDTLRKVKKNMDLSNTELYVVRIGPNSLGNPLKLSKPCDGCAKLILKSNVGRVFYSCN